jgi:histidinol dehydrogenase
MTWLNAASPETETALREIESRRSAADENASRVAGEMIEGVRNGGDVYVAAQIARFDGISIKPSEIRIEPRDVSIDGELAAALDIAIERVESFHRQQLPSSYRWERDGSEILHRVQPLRRVGIYVPGGRAIYISTLIMCAVPARIAGVSDLVVATTASAASRDELHYVCSRLGVREIYRCGGAAGIAAMALGTESLARVDMIAGPGNSYVTAAKARLVGEVGIDMTAGPTELVVIADESANAAFVQADLDAQQEHGSDSAVICISIGRALGVRATLGIVASNIDEAVAIADRIAPEHLSIQAKNAAEIAARARNCGAIYCGPFSPPAVGDYIAGSNHVLPTAGSARFFSPLGVYDFVKRTNVVTLSASALDSVASQAAQIARFEGLPQHAASMESRCAEVGA